MEAVSEPVSDDEPVAQSGLRVCHVIDTLKFGGAERQFVNVLNAMPASARFAIILRYNGQPGFFAELAPAIPRLTIRLRLRYGAIQIWQIVRWLRRQRIDVVHTHMFWPNLYGVVAARLARVPVVVTTDHGTDPWKGRHHHWLERNVITPRVDRRFCVSRNVFESLAGSGVAAEKLVIVSNGTEVPPLQRRVRTGPLHIGSVGRLVWEKDFASLIRAADLMRKQGLEFRLSIVGDGPLRADLQQQIKALGLEQMVLLTGFQSDIGAWLSRFDLFVMSSVEEGQPLALLEAMARGLPIIATRVGGIPDTLAAEREGVLVAPGDARALADAVLALNADPERCRRLGEQARNRVINEFSVQALARHYLDHYAQLWDARCRATIPDSDVRGRA
ncbi:MAG TPA: glycosyltransferase [Gammaproteobacteria bacterium]|nr:glycosyltransferase [Gammaproteobacteria bacterium]